MPEIEHAIETLAVMLFVGLAASVLADLVRVPSMLLLVGAGALVGPSALGIVEIPLNSDGAQLLLTLGVSFILFHGGLQLSLSVLRGTVVGLLLLVVPGVLLMAAVTGGVAALVFGVPLLTGLLIGAALAPIDPAILIPLFDRLRLRPRLEQTIVAESALNDATAAVLTIALAAAVVGGDSSIVDPALDFLVDVLVSTVLGIAFGLVLSLVVSSGRAGVWRESSAIAVVALLAASFVAIEEAGGSGYLGAFFAGLIVGNMDELRLAMHGEHERELHAFAGAATDIVVILVFVALGANLPFDAIADELAPALGVVATLVVVARPLAVAACLGADRRARWSRQELVFLAWTRETGVVAAALAGLVVARNVPDAELVVVTVSVALVVTLLVQTTTKPWLARRLGLVEP